MAPLRSILLLLVFASSFLICFTESSRKKFSGKQSIQDTVLKLGHTADSNRIDPSRVVQLSWKPRVFLYKGFLSVEECDRLISLVHGRKKEDLGNNGNSEHVVTNRLLMNSKMHLNIEDDLFSRIEDRISTWTFLPKENSRPLQVMHYGLEKVDRNYNFFGNRDLVGVTEPLMAIVVLYLSNVTQGGEILFPESKLKNKIWSDCMGTLGNSISRPIKGNAILFYTLHPNASPDKSSSHARCPVLEGEMWHATKFFHIRSISGEKVSPESDGSDDTGCIDEDENCPRWAAIGECQRNPVFMIGSHDYYGTCRKSCKAC